MNRIVRVVLLFVVLSLVKLPAIAQESRPNILYFYVDDMGWGSIGPNGQEKRKADGLPYVRTPNINRLAAEGINFLRGYGCHVCSPARSSQQTGFHQGHTFADRNDPNNAKKAIRADDITMGDVLSKAGYVTGYWGKWGYGGSKDQANPEILNVQTLPTSHGYQHVFAELHHVRAHTFFQPTLWKSPPSGDAKGGLELAPNSMAKYQNSAAYPNTPSFQNHAGYPKIGYCDDAYAFAALDFVRAQGQNYNKTGQPFFGLLAVQVPHSPFAEITQLPEWDRAYADDPHFETLSKQSQQWAAMVTRIDAHFGNIMAALEDPNNDGDKSDSVADNTLVIFQSDNGGPKGKNNIEFDANGGLKGTKGSVYEGGIRVPLVMRWPAKITKSSPLKAGTNSKLVVDVTDLLPTFSELAKTEPPVGIDGVSIAPTLAGDGYQRKRDFVIHESNAGNSIIYDSQKLIVSRKGATNLYDLDKDHSESSNIASARKEVVDKLKTLLVAERVTEPKGFANTYHHWKGQEGGKMSDPGNWSEYEYSNAGVSYLKEAGGPTLSWIATMANSDPTFQSALLDSDANFLGLAIGGGSSLQEVIVKQGNTLNARNEIRIANNGLLTLGDGTLRSARWVDVKPGGSLAGTGVVETSLHNSGHLSIGGGYSVDRSSKMLTVEKDFFQTAQATLRVTVATTKQAKLSVRGIAQFNGKLEIELGQGVVPNAGQVFNLVSAKSVSGRFSNAENEVTAAGIGFRIKYSQTAVMLEAK